MKVLFLMQNQWFRDPEAIRKIYDRWPNNRWELNRRFLFSGCRTGRVLIQAFGREFVFSDRCFFENASPQIASESSGCFPADIQHIRRCIAELSRPLSIVALGRIAGDAVRIITPELPMVAVYYGPHPTARGVNTVFPLHKIRKQLT